MNVREVINEALNIIGYQVDTLTTQDNTRLEKDVSRFAAIADSERKKYPFFTSQQIAFDDLDKIKFSEIASVVAVESNNSTVTYPLTPISLYQYNEYNRITKVGGIPIYYYWEKSGILRIYPQLVSNYEFIVNGRLISLSDITADTELDSNIPLFFIEYLTWQLAKRLCGPYQRNWTPELETGFQTAKEGLIENSDEDYHFWSPSSNAYNSRIYRPRNLIRYGQN